VFHHLPRNVSGNAQDRSLGRTSFEQFRNALMPEIVKPESLQASGSRELAPGRAPRFLRTCSVNVQVLARRENVELRPSDSELSGPVEENAESERRIGIQRDAALPRFALAVRNRHHPVEQINV